MDTSGRFKINLTELPDDGASLGWHLNDYFFSDLDQEEIQHGNLDVTLRVNRKSSAYELFFHVKGEITIPCDRCLGPMTQAIDTEGVLKVRLGTTYEDDGEEITVPEEHAEVDVAWNIYEFIVLAIPIYHAHPDGECSEDVNQFFADREEGEGDTPTDSRWDALKVLLNPSE